MEPLEFVQQELESIRHIFDIQKELYPMIILIKDDNRYQVPIVFHSSAQKDIVAQGIKDLVKKAKPDIVVYMAEAWVKFIRNKEDRLPAYTMDPNKMETLEVQIEFSTGEKYSCEAIIDRKPGHTRLLPFEISNNDYIMGRFIDFFPIKRFN